MKSGPIQAAVIVAATLLMTTSKGFAETFDERWGSLFGVKQISSETVSAKAELARAPKAKIHTQMRRDRVRRSRGERRREWYKGGKRWHYVYSRRRAR